MKNALWVCLLFVFFGCTNTDRPKPLPTEATLGKINFFMEVSGSMAGYLKGSTDFVKTVPNLLIAIERNIDSGKQKLHNYYIADSVTTFNGSTQDFINTLATQHPAHEKSSEMHQIFKMIADKTDTNDISIFVSDCILSYSDADIRANKEINREKAEGGLKPVITSTFVDLQKKHDICASVYGFDSDFDGIYYTYQNEKIQIKKGAVTRPYFLWVIGNKELLKKFNGQLQKLEQFKKNSVAMDFGIFSEPVKSYDLFFKFKKEGEWQIEGNRIIDAKISKTTPLKVAVAVDLSSLPVFAQDINYLKEKMQLDKTTADFKITSILKPEEISKGELKKNELDVLTNSTHIFIVEISDIYKPKSEMKFRLPLLYDTAYKAISIMDDRDVKNISGKTFAFEHLVDGVRLAYQKPNEDFVSITIPLNK